MSYKTNRQNHDFQLLYFIVGACHTPDAAYGALIDQEDDRKAALARHASEMKREKAKRLAAERLMKSEDEEVRLNAEADLMDIEASQDVAQKCYDAAVDELAFIQLLMAKLEPHRKFKHLPIREAHQAAQHDEWMYELMKRAENYLFSGNSIPADHFGTMRLHPAWKETIEPHIKKIVKAAQLAVSKGQADGIELPSFVAPLTDVKLETLLLTNKETS